MCALLDDIELAIHQADKYANFKYRIGTIILHNDEDDSTFNIVDGQQRIITLALICKVLETSVKPVMLNVKITSKTLEENIQRNFLAIKSYFTNKSIDEKGVTLKRWQTFWSLWLFRQFGLRKPFSFSIRRIREAKL